MKSRSPAGCGQRRGGPWVPSRSDGSSPRALLVADPRSAGIAGCALLEAGNGCELHLRTPSAETLRARAQLEPGWL